MRTAAVLSALALALALIPLGGCGKPHGKTKVAYLDDFNEPDSLSGGDGGDGCVCDDGGSDSGSDSGGTDSGSTPDDSGSSGDSGAGSDTSADSGNDGGDYVDDTDDFSDDGW